MWVGLGLFQGAPALAIQTKEYIGKAIRDGQLFYTEYHRAEYSDKGKVLKAVTEYKGTNGQLIARLSSDFTKSTTVPDHKLENFSTGNIQGIRRVGSDIVMFDQDKGKPEKTEIIKEDPSSDRMLVASQGLNYFILDNLEHLEKLKRVPLTFAIPGRLDTFSFELNLIEQTPDGIAHFELAIKSLILKLFAPRLFFQYDIKAKRITWYKGLSNVNEHKGDVDHVTIEYQ